MSKDEIIGRLKPFLADIFDVSEDEITEKTDFYADLAADEYDFVEMSMIIEEEFGITDAIPKRIKTVGDLASYAEEKTR